MLSSVLEEDKSQEKNMTPLTNYSFLMFIYTFI